jgi:hypothetical protein
MRPQLAVPSILKVANFICYPCVEALVLKRRGRPNGRWNHLGEILAKRAMMRKAR